MILNGWEVTEGGSKDARKKRLDAKRYAAKWETQILEMQGRWREAEPFYTIRIKARRSLASFTDRTLHFVHSPRTGLAINLMKQGRLQEAENTARSALRDMLAIAGKYSLDLNGLDQPALALSSPTVTGGEGDGLLTMEEILGLRLNADWAVLSACNTASADGKGAEAASGLGRAFLYAGARALLVSNWPVHSGATTELMTNLFQLQAANDNFSRTEALRRTQIRMIDELSARASDGRAVFSYAHPLFWAPFSLIGDGGGAKPSA